MAQRPQASGEFDGVRAYRRGDPLKLVVWRKAAKADELVSRDAQHAQRFELWLDFARTGVADTEHKLSRLCAWVLAADKLGLGNLGRPEYPRTADTNLYFAGYSSMYNGLQVKLNRRLNNGLAITTS